MSNGAGWAINAASTPSKAPRAIMIALPPMSSSAGVPSTIRVTAPGETAPLRPSAPPRPAVAMRLWPQAWPISGRASYSHR